MFDRPGLPPCGIEPELAGDQQRRSIVGLGCNPGNAAHDRQRDRDMRRRLRGSYGCDCNGEEYAGRVEPEMTDGPLQAVEDWAGARPITCPWKAFFDPFVARALDAHWAFESGNLSVVMPAPSHRLVMGVLYLHKAMQRITSMQIAQDRKAEKQRQAGGR
jgi:hypothetical protein